MNKKSFFFSRFLPVLALAFAGGLLGGALVVTFSNPTESNENNSPPPSRHEVYVEESAITETVKKVSPSVVSIVVTKDLPLYRSQMHSLNLDDFFNDPFADPFFGFPFQGPQPERDENGNIKRERQKIGGGTGFIVTKDGLVATNKHVVDDESADYTVILNDGTEYPAQVLSRDVINDFAVLKIQADEAMSLDLPVIPLGNSDELEVGQRVVAIGNALAEYENTVTTGVISAKGRSIVAGNGISSEQLINLLQTDAAINPGNSGGPLVNLKGQVIGINTAIASGAQGIGFAIPINDVKPLLESVQEFGKIVRPYLGVRYLMLDEAKAKELQLDVEGGALLVGNEAAGEFAVIPGSPADKAGLKIKDVILEVDGEKLAAESPLHLLIARKKPGDSLTLTVWRSGEILTLPVTLAEAP